MSGLIERVSGHEEIEYVRTVATVSELEAGRGFDSAGFTKYDVESTGIRNGSRFYDQSNFKFETSRLKLLP